MRAAQSTRTMRRIVLLLVALALLGATACSLQPKSKVQHLTYQTFLDEIWDCENHPDSLVFKSDGPLIIDFYSKNCRPCRQLDPIMDTLANDYEGRVKFYKANRDEEPKLASVFKVTGLPVVVTFSETGGCDIYRGLPSEARLREIIEEQLLVKTEQE